MAVFSCRLLVRTKSSPDSVDLSYQPSEKGRRIASAADSSAVDASSREMTSP
jgi:hypothetical protein